MSHRIRLLLAAAAIVGISLVTSGIVSLLLVQSLEFDNAQVELDRTVVGVHRSVLRAECQTPATVSTATACVGSKLASAELYKTRLSVLLPVGNAQRLLLVSNQGIVVYDNESNAAVGTSLKLSRRRTIDQATTDEGMVPVAGTNFIAAGLPLTARRDPLGAGHVVILRSSATINALAIGELLPRLLEAGLIALAVALALALVLSRAFARPLSELAAAAEDIAAGNYSRRVGVSSTDEVGVVGRSFNRMGEAVERARTLQRDFLANVSHELKTPLTSLIGFSQALVDGSLGTPEERLRAAQIINEEAQRVLRMSQELLDLARVESGQLPIHLSEVDLRALLEQEIEIVRPRAAARRLEIQLKAPADPRPVLADVERLHQVIDNLLDNAVKYAPEGTVVDVTVSNGMQNVEVAVGNRVGERPPDPDRMFERFYRGDPARTSVAGGVGLGLSISRELASAQGGRLWAELEGSALTVRLTLPAATPGGPLLPSPAC